MKRKFLVLLAILAVTCWAPATWASSITITDPPEGSADGVVAVTAGGFTSTSFHHATETAWGSAYLLRDGFHYNLSVTLVFNEPGGGVSDFLKIWTTCSPKTIYFNFESDGAANWAYDSTHLVNPVYITETGGLQNVTSFFHDVLGCSGVNIYVKSDKDAVVPIPPTALLLGSGLLGLVGWRRFRKS